MEAMTQAEEAGKLDAVGIGLSVLCGIHCLSVPFLLGALPMLGLGIVADHSFEWVMMAIIFSVAAASYWSGHRVHGRRAVWAYFAVGVAVFALLRPSLPENLHPLATLSGGLAFVLGHWQNWRWRRSCRCSPAAAR
jgi:hypothetical protein